LSCRPTFLAGFGERQQAVEGWIPSHAEAASGDEVRATEVRVRLVQERLFSILLETEKPAAAIDLARLTSIINNLSRTTISPRRWRAESQARLVKLQRAAAGKISAIERTGGVSAAAAQCMRDLLLSIDPFSASSPAPDAPLHTNTP